MATIIDLNITAPPLPADWQPPAEPSGKPLSPLVKRHLLPVGTAYIAHVRRAINNHTFEQHDELADEARKLALLNGNADNLEDDLGVGDEEESEELLHLDPKEWKKQDHYAVLGLSQLRYRATQDQIKIAHRKKVLKHHPDKKSSVAGDSNDDAFFKCIQKALEILSHPEKRRQYDSVDQYYVDLEQDVPTLSEAKRDVEKRPEVFFEIFGPIFEREARFSKKMPVPGLGEMQDGKDAVEGFYNFWYAFDSWRSFEYLDKEVNEGSDNRDDKRYTEKKNKTERARRKREDNTRVRSLVDLALAVDPRMKRIKQEEKEAREAKKRKGKVNGVPSKAQLEEEKKRAEAEAKNKEEEEKAAREAAKKEKAAKANAAKKARRAARATDGNGA